MPATELPSPRLKRLPKVRRSSAFLIFLPALCLGIYWMFGEDGLIISTFAIPVIWAFYGGFEKTTPVTEARLRSNLDETQLETHINDALFTAKPNEKIALFCLEIDGASDAAKRLGSASLDDIQQRLHMRYASCLRSNDIVYQSGALQWTIILMPGVHLDLEAAIQQARRLQEITDEPFFVQDDRLYLTSCIGFSHARKPFKGAHVLLAQAQSALKTAILNGPDSIRAYQANPRKQPTLHHPTNAHDLNGDIETCLSAWFQPQISTDTGEISGFEALARWRDTAGQWHSPAVVLPILEQTGQMEQLTDIVLEQSLTALGKWDERDLNIATIGVNFSETDLANPRLFDKIAWELDRHNLAPERLCIEVLESVIAGEADDMIVRNVTRLAAHGCPIDLDDFGTGHSSISTLRRLPVHRLKIDRSFVAKADFDPEQQKMVATILMMADRLDLSCLAEGVETLGEQSILAQLGCRYAQGFGIGKPMAFEQTLEWIKTYQSKQLIPPQITRKTS